MQTSIIAIVMAAWFLSSSFIFSLGTISEITNLESDSANIQWPASTTIESDSEASISQTGSSLMPSSTASKSNATEAALNQTGLHLYSQNGLAWLDNIRLGDWLGSGQYSDTFEANILDPPILGKEYVIKFSGSQGQEELYADKAAHGEYISGMLSPHPSIPKTLYFARSIANPFQTGQFTLPGKSPDRHNSTGVQALHIERLMQSANVSVIVSERVHQTHKHLKPGSDILEVPPEKVRCFWRRYFEIVDYAHSKKVMVRDLKLWNILLQDGDMKFFDWNSAKVFETKRDRRERHRLNTTKPYLTCPQGAHPRCKAVHHIDVQEISKRLNEFLNYDKQKRRIQETGHRTAIPQQDRNDLKHLRDVMAVEEPPTLASLLEHHEYFLRDGFLKASCSLKW
eukprot:scaffold5088_cov98-Cylindrotheca_fusiformis.AAC.5